MCWLHPRHTCEKRASVMSRSKHRRKCQTQCAFWRYSWSLIKTRHRTSVRIRSAEPADLAGAAQAECEASMMHGSELADARAAVWQSAAGRLLEVRDAADSLVRAHVRPLRPCSDPVVRFMLNAIQRHQCRHVRHRFRASPAGQYVSVNAYHFRRLKSTLSQAPCPKGLKIAQEAVAEAQDAGRADRLGMVRRIRERVDALLKLAQLEVRTDNQTQDRVMAGWWKSGRPHWNTTLAGLNGVMHAP